MRRTIADRQRRRDLVDISVTASTPVTAPGPVHSCSTPPLRLHTLQDGQGTAVHGGPEPEAAR